MGKVLWKKLPPLLKCLAILAGLLGVTSGQSIAAFAVQLGSDLLDIREQLNLPTQGAAVAVSWSPDGSALAAVSDYGGVITVWDRDGRTINKIKRIGGGPALEGSLAFVRDSSQVAFLPPESASDSAAFAVWDVSNGQLISLRNGPQPGEDYPLNRARIFVVSPNQALLVGATAGNQGKKNFQSNIFAYDTHDWRMLYRNKISPGISSLCVFAQGKRLGVGAINSGKVFILDAATGNTVSQFSAYQESKFGLPSLGAIAGSPSGDLILTGIGMILLSGEYHGSSEQLAWSKSIDSVRVFHAKDGSLVGSFVGAKGPIRQAVWDPKGRYIAFVDNARGLFLWTPWTGDNHKRIELPSSALSLAISPGGERIAVTTDHGVRVYSIN
jgi:WD40 repeat protein